jgi:hypothetical protein
MLRAELQLGQLERRLAIHFQQHLPVLPYLPELECLLSLSYHY